MILAPTLSLLSSGSGAIVRPTFSRDFAGERTLNNGTGPAINFTRGSIGTFFDAAGTLQTASNDVARFDHSGGTSLGLLIEEARTNSLRNSQAGGSANGVLGSATVPTPAVPTNWGANTGVAGATYEVIGTGTESGFAYIDIKISGTNSSGGNVFPNTAMETQTQIVAAQGQSWTGSFYVSLVAGSTAGVTSFNCNVFEMTSGGAVLASSQAGFTPTATRQRVSHTRQIAGATAERVSIQFVCQVANGNSYDFTLRIAAPQLEQGAFPTSYIPTTSAAVTRSADSAVVTPISGFYNQSEGTLFAEAIAGTASGTASGIHQQTVVQLLENNVGDILAAIYRPNGTTNGSFFVGTAGGTQANLAQAGFTAGVNTRLAAAYKTDDFALSVNGTAAATDTSGSLPTATTLRIGQYGTSSGFLNGHIRKVAYYPRRLSNALLQSLTT